MFFDFKAFKAVLSSFSFCISNFIGIFTKYRDQTNVFCAKHIVSLLKVCIIAKMVVVDRDL